MLPTPLIDALTFKFAVTIAVDAICDVSNVDATLTTVAALSLLANCLFQSIVHPAAVSTAACCRRR